MYLRLFNMDAVIKEVKMMMPPSYYIQPHLYQLYPKHIPNIWIQIQALNEPHTSVPPIQSPCSYLHWLSVLFFYTPTNCPIITLRSSFDSPHRAKSSAYKRTGNLSLNHYPLHLLPHMLDIIFISFYSLPHKRPSISFSVPTFPQFLTSNPPYTNHHLSSLNICSY